MQNGLVSDCDIVALISGQWTKQSAGGFRSSYMFAVGWVSSPQSSCPSTSGSERTNKYKHDPTPEKTPDIQQNQEP